MKIPINEAAARLRLHPCQLVLALAGMLASFDELYPEVDEGFTETLKQMHPERFVRPPRDVSPIPESRAKASPPPVSRLSKDSEHLVSVLSRKRHWGTNTVSEATLRNHYCRDLKDFDSAIKELVRAGILIAESPRGPFSLNTKAKARVDELTRQQEKGE